MIEIDKQPFADDVEHFAFPSYHQIADMAELAKLRLLARMTSANLASTTLDDRGLAHVANATSIAWLDLQDTRVSDAGLAHLARLPHLSYLRLKENRQLTNACVPHLLRLDALAELQIHETSIDQCGLDQLVALPALRQIVIDVWRDNFSPAALLALSTRMPRCSILAKGRGEFLGGAFSGTWAS